MARSKKAPGMRDRKGLTIRKKKLPVTTEYYKQDIEHLYAKPEKKKPMSVEELAKMEIPSADDVNEVLLEEGDDVKEYKIGDE